VFDRFPWRTAAKIAWREARASSTRFFFVVLAVALGVGALTGVQGFSEAFRGMLTRDARKLMAADLSVRTFAMADPPQMATMERLAQAGVARTHITETVSMLSTPTASSPVLVSIKAVDPDVYPFYGEFKLDPNVSLRDALQPDQIAVSDDLLVRLDIKRGDTVRLGEGDFRIAAIVITEPDRMAGSLNVGPRVMMSRAGLERTQLIKLGSRSAQRYLFRFDTGAPPVETARTQLKEVFPEALIIDYRETHPLITRGLDRSTKFLSLVSLIALLVGALGVAMAMHSHLQQKLDSIAVMKSLGARSSQIIRIYTLQTLILGLLGGAAGILVGLAVQMIFPQLLARYFQLQPGISWSPASALQGLVVGVLTTLLFTLPPLLSIRRIRPSLILRREMEDAKPGWRQRLRDGRAAVGMTALIGAGILGIVYWLSESLRTAAYFVGGFTASLLLLAGVSWLILLALRRSSRWMQTALPPTVRHGIANVYRPGNQASALLVALSLGVMFTLTVYLVQRSMLIQIASSAPPGMPNVFLINITPTERDGIKELLAKQPGLDTPPEVVPLVSARMTKVNGKAVEDFGFKGFNRRFTQTRSVSWSALAPSQTVILQGRWWKMTDTAQTAGVQVCVGEDAAKTLELKPGARLSWTASGTPFESQVVCIFRSEAVRIGSNIEFLFLPGALDNFPALHFAAVRLKPDAIAPLQREVFRRFPTITVINGADVLAIIQEVVDQIALIVRFISLFAILAGAIILSSSVAGTRFRRVREVVILKTLGATRARVAGIFSVEFLVLGAVAGILGSMLATAFSLLVLKRLFQVDYRFDPLPHVIAIVATALLANLAGWLASHRILEQKPLEALRESL
jgi:putative ABC transport system permease protein